MGASVDYISETNTARIWALTYENKKSMVDFANEFMNKAYNFDYTNVSDDYFNGFFNNPQKVLEATKNKKIIVTGNFNATKAKLNENGNLIVEGSLMAKYKSSSQLSEGWEIGVECTQKTAVELKFAPLDPTTYIISKDYKIQ